MELRIGVQNVTRELVIETEMSQDDVTAAYNKAVSENTAMEITDSKGRLILVPVATVGYIDMGESTARPVGFVANS